MKISACILLSVSLMTALNAPHALAESSPKADIRLPNATTQAIKNERWYGIYKVSNTKSMIKPVTISTQRTYSEMTGGDINIIPDQKGLTFLVKSTQFPITSGFTPALMSTPGDDHLTLGVNKTIPFQLNNKRFVLHATGQADNIMAKNYKLAVVVNNKPIPLHGLEPTYVQDMLWVGDLNKDGYPELLLSTRTYSENTTIRLYSISRNLTSQLLAQFNYD